MKKTVQRIPGWCYGVVAAIDIWTVLGSMWWGGVHGIAWYQIVTGPLHVTDYNLAASTSVLIGATAYFERQHADRTAKKMHDYAEAAFQKLFREHSKGEGKARAALIAIAHIPTQGIHGEYTRLVQNQINKGLARGGQDVYGPEG